MQMQIHHVDAQNFGAEVLSSKLQGRYTAQK